MSRVNFKQELFAQFAQVAKALSHGNRLELLEFLAQREHSVEDLSRISGLSVANTSQHLQLLRQAGLVATRKQGVKVFCRLSGDDVIALISLLRTVAKRHLAEVERLLTIYLHSQDSMEPIGADELLKRVKEGSAVALDVRPYEEYVAGHLPGALGIPLRDLELRISELPKRQEIIAYCRGPYCVLAFQAVATLRGNGLKARRLEYGFPEWKHEGHKIEY